MTETQKKTAGFAIAALILGLFFWFPFLGFLFSVLALIFGILALVKISKSNGALSGQGMAISGIVLGAIGILLIPIIAIMAAIAIPNLLKARMAANDSYARAQLNTLATAAEAYSTADGRFPANEDYLLNANPPYITEKICDKTANGYHYTCQFRSSGYEFRATPTSKDVSGSQELVVTSNDKPSIQ